MYIYIYTTKYDYIKSFFPETPVCRVRQVRSEGPGVVPQPPAASRVRLVTERERRGLPTCAGEALGLTNLWI